MKEDHSDKGISTLTLQGTTPDQWMLVPIKYVKEMREVLTEVCCPACQGYRRVLFDEEGNLIPMPVSGKNPAYAEEFDVEFTPDIQAKYDEARGVYKENETKREEYIKKANDLFPRFSSLGNCPKCLVKRNGYRTGRSLVMVLREVWVGYPQWPVGVSFRSRFKGGSSCQLCNKRIKKGGLVPVCTIHDVNPLGMWVGEDCAKKFLSVKVPRKTDHYIETPDGTL